MLPLSAWKETPFPSPRERSRGDQPAGARQPRGAGAAGPGGPRGKAAPAPPQPPALPRQPESSRPQGAPAARPAQDRAELGAPRALIPEGVNAVTSPPVSAAQQEMLSASPLPARRKWGSLLPPLRPRPSFGALALPALPGAGATGRRPCLCQGSLCRACQRASLCRKGREGGGSITGLGETTPFAR